MRKADVVVVGGASTDFIAYGPHLPAAGDESTGERFDEFPGGKGVNQAVAVARLGGSVALIARVGTDQRGEAVREHLSREGVETGCCFQDQEAPTGAILLMVDHAGTKQTVTVPGATGRLSVDDIARSEKLLEDAQVLLLQFEAPLTTVLCAMSTAHRLGRRVFVDAAPATSLPETAWEHIDLVRMNGREAAVLTGIEVVDARTARQAARYCVEHGVETVAIQAGAEGNLLMWRDHEVFLPLIPVATVDKTGAGDAFIAALAMAVLEGRSWVEAGWFANAAAALTTTKLGAGPALPRRADVLSLLARIKKP
jgi:ribokinase